MRIGKNLRSATKTVGVDALITASFVAINKKTYALGIGAFFLNWWSGKLFYASCPNVVYGVRCCTCLSTNGLFRMDIDKKINPRKCKGNISLVTHFSFDRCHLNLYIWQKLFYF